MSLKMIKEAATIAALGKKATFLEHVRQVLGAESLSAVLEDLDSSEFEINQDDYHKWLDTLEAEASEKQVDLNDKEAFDKLAFDMLDNDPKIDALSDSDSELEDIKRNLVNSIHKAYEATKAHGEVKDGIDHHIAATRAGETSIDSLAGSEPEDEEQSEFEQNFKAVHGMEDEEDEGERFSTLKSLIGKKKNPYEKGTLRHKIWADKHGDEMSNPDKEGTDYSDEDLAYNHDDDGDFSDEDFDDHELNGEDIDDDGNLNSDEFPSNDDEHTLSYGDAGRDHDVDDYIPRSHSRRAYADQFDMSDRTGDDMGVGDELDDEGRLETRAKTHGVDTETEPDFDEDNLDSEEDVGYGGAHDDLSDEEYPGEDDMGYGGAHDEEGLDDEDVGRSHRRVAHEEEEVHKPMSFLQHVLTSPKETLDTAVKGVEAEGEAAWKAHNLPQNPHPKKSLAHRAWERGMRRAVEDHFNFKKVPVVSTSKKSTRKR